MAVLNYVFERPQRWRRVLMLGLALALIGLHGQLWTGAGSRAEIATLEERIAAQRAENWRLGEQSALLEQEVRALKEDPGSLEARARALGMIRTGETFYLVLPSAPVAASADAP